MASLNCFCPSWKRKKNKGGKGHVDLSVKEKNLNTLHVKLDHHPASLDATELRSTSFSVPVPFCIARSSRCNVKVMSHGSPDAEEPCEAAYEGEGEDEHSVTLDSKFSFQACSENLVGEKGQNVDDDIENSNSGVMLGMNASGHVSDPRTRKARFWASPELKHSCSDLATRSAPLELEDQLRLAEMQTAGILAREELSENGNDYTDDKNWNGVYAHSRVWPQNQWFAFPPDSPPLWRVDEWVKEVISQPPCEDEMPVSSPPENGASSPRGGPSHSPRPSAASMLEEISRANTVVRSLNSNSTAAHVAGLGLAAIPSISPFSSLRSVNLCGNLIVQITPGSLPKGLHALNLSRNKISTIEGLRELTRLRVLDLSYNRISRIGQGLSNCTLIKELYLAGNKISVVEGLHRLLKLAVLGLSFNKITTAKALGQLVANYNTLIAVNLLGNPIQKNVSDDLLRKTLCGLLPKLVILDNQPINPRKARELRADANAIAALGNSSSSLSGRRKAVRKGAAQGSSSHSVRRSSVSTGIKSKHRTRSHSHHHSNLKDKA